MLRTLDLFSGIGGFALGLEATGFFRTTCFVELEPYCRLALKSHWPRTPILGDIKNVTRPDLPDPDPDVIVGGFPCQPYSHAGLQRAESDPRHLWPEMFRLIQECRPTWVVGENVTGITKLGLDEVLSDLENEGYATRTFNIPACALGAPHLRQRLWIIAHADSDSESDVSLNGEQGQRKLGKDMADPDWDDGGRGSCTQSQGREARMEHGSGGERCGKPDPDPNVADTRSQRKKRLPKNDENKGRQTIGGTQSGGCSEDVADTKGIECKRSGAKRSGQGRSEEASGGYRSSRAAANYWETEPQVGRLVDGLPDRVPRLRALGNSIIPQIAEEIGYAIRAAETDKQKTECNQLPGNREW